ncbi:uncharacterized protein LOC135476381 [Liolophura sinensis]|uniref:uncharacterized protein LOC135476381 n=1 Tax=Liolophura sinensis TaxID=3198878 RepID=UPI00315920E4
MPETCQVESLMDKRAVYRGVQVGALTSRLTSRLCYLLRYGAVKEGMRVCGAGFVRLSELLQNRLMKSHTEQEVLQEIDSSHSKRGPLRFERKEEDGVVYVRARFARRFELNPFHDGTKVPTLMESGLQYICTNINQFDLDGFPDEYLINSILHRLKREKRLNSEVLRSVLTPALEHLDLEGIYLTEGVVRHICHTCSRLRVVSFKDCGYVLNDHLLEQIARKLPRLESLNLAACSHLTERSLRALTKHCAHLTHLNISMIKGISEMGVVRLLENAPKLQHLDMFDHRVSKNGRKKIHELAKECGCTVVLRGLEDPGVAPPDPCLLLPNFGKVWY